MSAGDGIKRVILDVRDLTVSFSTRSGGQVNAVDGVSFALHEREILGIVGESGSGKSVTCLAILGLVPTSTARIVSGQVLLQGEDVLRKTDRELRRIRGGVVAMILQDPMASLNPSFSIGHQVGQMISLHQRVRDRRQLRKLVIAALKRVQIPDPERRIGDYPHQLSGGMRQRVAGAIALSCKPRILIADEPTTALDVTVQAQYLELLKKIHDEEDVSIVLVTHDLGIVFRFCDRVAVMYAGRIVEVGTTQQILEQPSHPYTVALLKSVPNLDASDRLTSIRGEPPDPSNFPSGCRFAPRCPRALGVPSHPGHTAYPEAVSIEQGHWAACWDAHSVARANTQPQQPA